MEATCAGAVFVGLRRYIEEHHTRAALEQMVLSFPEEDRAPVLSNFWVNTSRVNARYFRLLGDALVEHAGLTGPNGLHAAAAHVAMSDLASYMKVLMKLGTPSFVLNRFPRVFSHYFSHGSLVVLDDSDRRALVRISDAADYGDAGLEGALGWMRAALAYSGAKEVNVVRQVVDTRCSDYQIRFK